jgi:hypothetical protein
MVSQESFGEAQSCLSVVTDFALRWAQKLPAQKTGGLYKTSAAIRLGFVEATPSRAFRDGVGIFAVKLGDNIFGW